MKFNPLEKEKTVPDTETSDKPYIGLPPKRVDNYPDNFYLKEILETNKRIEVLLSWVLAEMKVKVQKEPHGMDF